MVGNQYFLTFSLYIVQATLSYAADDGYLEAAANEYFESAMVSGVSEHPGYGKALEIWEDLRGKENLLAQYRAATIYMHGLGGVEKNERKAVDYIFDSAKKGLPIAQYWIAWQREEGGIIEKNPNFALHWYEEAANSCHLMALTRMRQIYEYGELGVNANPDILAKWEKKRASCKVHEEQKLR